MTAPGTGVIRFRGDSSNPNHGAVLHLLKAYAGHLDLRLEEARDGAADIHWGAPPEDAGGPAPRISVPARPTAHPDMDVIRSPEGYPFPRSSVTGPSGDPSPRTEGPILKAGWDILSFCADILFRRADFLPEREAFAREAVGKGQWDEAAGLLEAPWVDRWMFRLLARLPAAADRIKALPGRASLWLTHDLDNLAKWRPRSVAGQVLRTPAQLLTGQAAVAIRHWKEIAARAFTGRDPFDVMDRVLALEKGRRSANFFLATGTDHLFHRYDLEKPRFRRVLEACRAAGMDLGLHGQVHFIRGGAGMRAEKDKMERLAGAPVRMNRQHYLRWDPAGTFKGLAASGIAVDSTLGYNDSPGFRCGTAHPFPWFDCATDKALPILEVPLILGEFQFYDPRAFDGTAVRETLRRYLDLATAQGGVFTALFHSEYFYEAQNPGHAKVYSDLLEWAKARNLPDFDPMETFRRRVETAETAEKAAHG